MNSVCQLHIISVLLMIGDAFGDNNVQESNHRWKRSTALLFNDPGYPKQFYLNDKFGVTMNIRKAWLKGYTGKNVTICIDDPTGMYHKHDELSKRFNLAGSYNFGFNKSDPSPPPNVPTFGSHAHGTMMGGLAAGEANNGKCGVGVAYDAYITATRSYSDETNEAKVTADSLSYANQINDIYSCSWTTIGMNANNVGYMAPEVKVAVRNSAEKGRGGNGNIYVFANGNEGFVANGTCGYSEYVSSIYTISISVVTIKNAMSVQNVQCTGISAVSYSRDSLRRYPDDLMPTCANNNECARTSASSSAAAAVSSGIFALVLQANPNLGWRDLQHLIARSSCSVLPSVPWKTNKAGIRVSDGFGFGLLDADALIENAKNWTNVGRHLECILDYKVKNERIDGVDTTVKSVDVTTWPANCGGESQRINFLEHVLLVVSFNYTERKLVEIEIEAPTGTKSIVLRSGRKFDRLDPDVKNLSILTLHHWGENPKGIWTMRLRNVNPNSANSGNLSQWGFRFYGTKDDPLASNTIKPSQIRANFTNTTSKPTTSPRNTASQSSSSTSPTVKPNATTNTINGTTGTTRKVPTTTKKGNGAVLLSCKWMMCACAILLLSLIWEISC